MPDGERPGSVTLCFFGHSGRAGRVKRLQNGNEACRRPQWRFPRFGMGGCQPKIPKRVGVAGRVDRGLSPDSWAARVLLASGGAAPMSLPEAQLSFKVCLLCSVEVGMIRADQARCRANGSLFF